MREPVEIAVVPTCRQAREAARVFTDNLSDAASDRELSLAASHRTGVGFGSQTDFLDALCPLFFGG